MGLAAVVGLRGLGKAAESLPKGLERAIAVVVGPVSAQYASNPYWHRVSGFFDK